MAIRQERKTPMKSRKSTTVTAAALRGALACAALGMAVPALGDVLPLNFRIETSTQTFAPTVSTRATWCSSPA